MSANKRTELQIAEDRAYIAEQVRTGRSIRSVGEELNRIRPYQLSAMGWWLDWKAIMSEWREATLQDVDHLQAQQLERLDWIIAELKEQWEASKCPIKKWQRKIGGQASEDAGELEMEEEQLGDPRYMQQILVAMDKQAKILGLDAPIKQEHSGEVAISAMSEEQSTAFNAYLKAIEDKVKARTEKQPEITE